MPESVKINLRGVQSLAPGELSQEIREQGRGWPIAIGNIPPVAHGYQPRSRSLGLDPSWLSRGRRTRVYAITGLGGVGKTQSAAALAREAIDSEEVDLLLWVSAQNRDAILTAYVEAVRAVLGVTRSEGTAETAAVKLVHWLSTTKRRWLVVLDNLLDPLDMTGLWPSGSAGSVLITTRRINFVEQQHDWRTIRLGVYEPAEASRYLAMRLKHRPEALDRPRELCETLGYLPLALTQAASYMLERDLTCSAYLELFRRSAPGAGGDDQTHERMSLLGVTSELALQAARIRTKGGTAEPLLVLTSLLDPNGIPEMVLRSLAVRSYLVRRVQETTELVNDGSGLLDEKLVVDALSALNSFGLVGRDLGPDAGVLRVPAAVQSFASEEGGDFDRAARAAADALLEVWPDDDYRPGNATLTQSLCSNVDALRDSRPDALWSSNGFHPVLFQAGYSRISLGLVNEGIEYWLRLSTEALDRLGNDDISTVRVRANLGAAYRAAGRLSEAIELLEEASVTCNRLLGPDHPDTLAAQNNLASCYQESGRLGEAIAILEQTLSSRQRVFGPEHPNTLTSMNNLATAYQASGRISAAIELLSEAVTRRETVLGTEHPDTLITKNNLALAYLEQGRLNEGLTLLETVSFEYERVLGVSHPRTLASRNSLAAAYLATGKAQDAVPFLERTLADSEMVLGPDHPDTLAIRNNLGRAYQAIGRLSESIELLELNAENCGRILGWDHPDTLASRYNLAAAYRAVGRNDDALRMFRTNLVERERVLGPDHPDSLASRGRLANALREVGLLDEAIGLHEEVLERQTRLMGPAHPDTLTTRNNIALAYQEAGRIGDAINLLQETLADRERVLGADHPQTLASRNNLAIAYWDAGRLREALPLLESTLQVKESAFGMMHPSTLASRTNLALAYQEAGAVQRAIDLLERNLTESAELFGSTDRTTLTTASNLASAYRAAGRLVDSEALLQRTYQAAEESLGGADPTTVAVRRNLEIARTTERLENGN